MSLAVLARKTKTQQRLRSTKCGAPEGRSVGFVLNMTGRGGGIGLSGMSYKQRGVNCRSANYKTTGCQCKGCCEGGGRCKTGQAGTCCAGDHRKRKCSANCKLCWYNGLSQPAPQMSYRTYINRKANGAYRPGGKVCCKTWNRSGTDECTTGGNECLKPQVTWKQSPDISASTITEHRRQATVRCATSMIKRNPVYLGGTLISDRINAKPVCSWYNPVTCKYETVDGTNPLLQNCQCATSLPIKGRLGYTRINKNWCNTTKTLTVGTSSSDQIAKRKQRGFLCPCGPETETCSSPEESESKIVHLGVDYGLDGYFLSDGPTKLCRCDRTFVLTLTPPAGQNHPHFISVINPARFEDSTGSWEELEANKFYSTTDLAIKLNENAPTSFKIPAEWCEAGYKKLYVFELSNPHSDFPYHPVWDICAGNCDNKERENARYCYPRPFHTGRNCGPNALDSLSATQRAACKLGCPKHWNSGNLRL